MIYVYVSHKVADFSKWKPYFDSDEDARKSFGLEVKKLFRAAEDSNDVHILFEAPDEHSVKTCIERPLLKELMQRAGVISEPVFKILNIA
jgi:hypothetical protein